jgi:hypothetical protein
MLDIVIDTLNNKLGGSTKYINQRDEDFFPAIIKEPHYRKEFTSALNRFVDMGKFRCLCSREPYRKIPIVRNHIVYSL